MSFSGDDLTSHLTPASKAGGWFWLGYESGAQKFESLLALSDFVRHSFRIEKLALRMNASGERAGSPQEPRQLCQFFADQAASRRVSVGRGIVDTNDLS